ncbi:c-type cytochrome [Sulfurimonas sp. CS5]|jgi:cytochrome c553|uniref:c-type cytochrome n=1 Tax=Sulfurimonas sp. CS5 TaxID=3391145 RepID=UPI0039ECB12B
MKIAISVALVFLLIGCSEESKQEVQKSEPKESTPKELVIKETPVITTVLDAKALFKVCASCHGQNAEKAALGKSKIIKGWSVRETTIALNGYKDGSYGGPMKSVMKGQANKLNDEQIKVIGEYISKL